jgi:hypothetical protein
MSNIRIVRRGKEAVWHQEFWADSAHTVALVPASGYPKWAVRDPNGMAVMDGVGAQVSDGTWQATWNVPKSAPLSNAELRYEIVWEMTTDQGRTVQATEQFDVIDETITEATHRHQKFVALAKRPFPVMKRFTFKPAALSVEIVNSRMDAMVLQSQTFYETNAVPDGDSWIYTFVIDASVLAEDQNYTVLWTFQETVVSVPDVVYDIIDTVSVRMLQFVPDVRMFIDKYQKKVGRVQAYEDSDIFEYIRRGKEIVNAWHPMTSWGTEFSSPLWSIGHLWRLAAVWYGLGAQYLLETDLAFNFSGQTVTLDYDRTGNIDNMQGKLMDLFDKQLTPAKQHLFRMSRPAGVVAGRPYMMGRIYNYTYKIGPAGGGMAGTFFGWLNSLGIII